MLWSRCVVMPSGTRVCNHSYEKSGFRLKVTDFWHNSSDSSCLSPQASVFTEGAKTPLCHNQHKNSPLVPKDGRTLRESVTACDPSCYRENKTHNKTSAVTENLLSDGNTCADPQKKLICNGVQVRRRVTSSGTLLRSVSSGTKVLLRMSWSESCRLCAWVHVLLIRNWFGNQLCTFMASDVWGKRAVGKEKKKSCF